MSQRELGELLGVHQQQVTRWESTQYRTANLGRVAAVAAALGVEPSEEAAPLKAAETAAAYSASATAVAPVRDLGEVAARIRAHGDTLRDEWGIGRIGVFGSFAVGEQTPESDVDLLVEIADRDKVRGLRLVEAPKAIEAFLGRRVDFVEPRLLKDRLGPRILDEVVYVWQA